MTHQEIVYNGERRRAYYSYDEELYGKDFPESWAKSQVVGSGPKWCVECKKNGNWNGVFIGYCVGCATKVYNGSRGTGMCRPGMSKGISLGISMDEQGDIDFYDSRAIFYPGTKNGEELLEVDYVEYDVIINSQNC